MVLTCNLCGAQGGTDSVTHSKICIYKNHITYKKENKIHVILSIINNSESETINEYNK